MLTAFWLKYTDVISSLNKEHPDIENYTDNTTPYACVYDINTVISKLQITASKLFTWFNNNHKKANPEKTTFFWIAKLRKKFILGQTLVESSQTE